MRTSKDLSIEELRLLGEAIDNSTSPLTLYDPDYKVIYANAVAREFWPDVFDVLENGGTIEQAIEKQTRTLMPGAPEDLIVRNFVKAIRDVKSTSAREMLGSNGRWAEFTHHTIMDKAIVGVGVEITSLMAMRRLQEKTINVLDLGLMIISDDGIITQCNTAYKQYTKSRGLEAKVGMHFKDISRAVYNAEKFDIGNKSFDDWFEQYFKENFGKENELKQVEFTLNDGRHYLRRQSYYPNIGNIITVMDITDVKNAQLKAEEAERAKSEFLANMSHEIRTPMNGVMGMAQLLENCDLGPKEKNFVSTIHRSGEALLTIINDILDFSKIEAGQIKLNPSPFTLRESIEDVIALLSAAAAEKQIELLLRIQPGLPNHFIGDVGRFRQVITNIIGNAVKFTHRGHVLINVNGSCAGGEAQLNISVRDTGIGIAASELRHVFEKFRQVDGSSTRKYEGTGLGLSIATQLLTLMGGDIDVESEEGKGTTFKLGLTLPLAKPQAKTVEVLDGFAGASILVIDDNPVNRDILKEQLKIWNCKSAAVDSAKLGLKALRLAQEKGLKIDLVIVDYHMPNLSGEDFINHVKEDDSLKDIPVLMLTSIADDASALRMKTRGLDAYLTKPPRAAVFKKTLAKLLRERPQISVGGGAHINNIADKKQNEPVSDIATLKPSAQLDVKGKSSVSSKKFITPLNELAESQLDILVAEDNEVNQMYIGYILDETGLNYKIVEDGHKAIEAYEAFHLD